MFVIELTISIACLIILLFNFLLYLSLNRSEEDTITNDSLLEISVIVAAKNEENNVAALINSLQALDYPSNKYEVIFVDDNSDDDTYEVVRKLITGIQNYKLTRAENKILPAKKGALQVGLLSARYNFIVTTDADCIVQPQWLKYISNKFMSGFDIVFGISTYIKDNNFTNLAARYFNFRSHILIFGFANLGMPYSAFGANFGYNKSSFSDKTLYVNNQDTLSGDDDLLLKEAVRSKKSIGFTTNLDAAVYTKSKSLFPDFIKQKSRHTSTSLHYLLRHKIILSLWHVPNVLAILLLPLGFYESYFLLPFLMKIILDLLLHNRFQEKFGYRFGLPEVLISLIIYEFILVIAFFNSFSFKKRWE